jgi:hypothetical protein
MNQPPRTDIRNGVPVSVPDTCVFCERPLPDPEHVLWLSQAIGNDHPYFVGRFCGRECSDRFVFEFDDTLRP